jgi:hypothetical protein
MPGGAVERLWWAPANPFHSGLDALTPHDVFPDVHIFTRSKVPWVALPPAVRAYEVYYDMEKEWPADSWARRKAAMAHS